MNFLIYRFENKKIYVLVSLASSIFFHHCPLVSVSLLFFDLPAKFWISPQFSSIHLLANDGWTSMCMLLFITGVNPFLVVSSFNTCCCYREAVGRLSLMDYSSVSVG